MAMVRVRVMARGGVRVRVRIRVGVSVRIRVKVRVRVRVSCDRGWYRNWVLVSPAQERCRRRLPSRMRNAARGGIMRGAGRETRA